MTNAKTGQRIKGKEFVNSLEACKSTKEVFELLYKTFNGDGEKMKERASHVHDSPHIVKLNAHSATFKATLERNTRHQDCMNMAAYKYIRILSGSSNLNNMKDFIKQKKMIVRFRADVNKFVTQKSLEQEKLLQTKTNPIEKQALMMRDLSTRG